MAAEIVRRRKRPGRADAPAPVGAVNPDELIPAERMLKMLRVSDMTLRRWNAAGRFPDPIAIGARRFWRGRDYLAWLDTAPRKRAVVTSASPAAA